MAHLKSGLWLILWIITFSFPANAQLIVTTPAFPADVDEVEVIFNASLGNGGLAGYAGEVYAHTGVITDLSSGPSDWKYVKTDWGQNTPATLLERIGNDLYKLTIGPSIRQYYNVPASETILQLAFVFRSGVKVNNQWLEGKTETGGDIFAEVYPDGLFTRFNFPVASALLSEPGEEILIESISNEADSMFLFINESLTKSVAGNILHDTITSPESGKNYVRILAKNQAETAVDSFYFFVRQPVIVQALPDGVADGINYINDSTVTLCLYAPFKEHVFVIGDFNNWEFEDEGYLFRTPDEKRYWITLNNLVAGKEYIFQYLVDGNIRIGDPYAEKVSDPWNDKYISQNTYPGILTYPATKTTGVATVLQTAKTPYNWEVDNFQAPPKSELVVYELLVRDFVAKHDYQTLIDTLDYLKRLGINAIELMPFNEFEGNSSWGYNPNFYFAPDKYYGPENDLRRFIDECHKQGIAVIMDMVLNHSFGTSPMVMLYWDAINNRPAENNPWFNPIPKHDFNVGFDFNHESPDTKALVNRVVKFWIENYKIDGYRFDLSKGFTQKNTLNNTNTWGLYDASRIAIWKAIADTIWSVNPDAYVILEHFAENAEEKVLANYGMMIWGKMSDEYANAAKGSSASNNFNWASYKARGWNEPNLISYMESHDEERIMYLILKEGSLANPAYRTRDTTIALQRVQLANVFHYMIPGPKMLWQFGELGYDISIDFNGRTGEKPIKWNYTQDYRRRTLKNVISSLIKLRQSHNVFSTTDFTLSLSGYQKKIQLNHPDMTVLVIGNFDVFPGSMVPGFPSAGKWFEYFTGDSISVASVSDAVELKPGEYRIYTNVRLTKPETGLGIGETGETNMVIADYPYPNPLIEGQLIVPVFLFGDTDIEINVTDLTGRNVSQIYSGRLSGGEHRIKWNATAGLKPGIYILSARAQSFSKSFRIVLP